MTLPTVTPELSEEQIAQLEAARAAIPKLKAEIRRAKLAGIDLTQQEMDLLELEASLDKLYRTYVRRLPGGFTTK